HVSRVPLRPAPLRDDAAGAHRGGGAPNGRQPDVDLPGQPHPPTLMADTEARFPIDNVDATRGPTASQAAGLTLGAAKACMKAAMAKGRELRVAVSVAVVDQGGQLVAFERLD